MTKANVLLVDDDIEILETSKILLSDEFNIETCKSVDAAKRKIAQQSFDVAVVDLNFEGQAYDGIDLLDFIIVEHPNMQLIVLSGDTKPQRILEAAKRPLINYVIKDGDHEALLRQAIRSALLKCKRSDSEIKFKSNSILIQGLLAKAEMMIASGSTAPVLITGESGTGKEYLAQYIAKRIGGPIVAFNAATVAKDVAESELFGHKKGAFTGATSDKIGLLEQADGGVCFLDEIGELPLSVQPKLLRAIQEQEILPIGATRPKKIAVKFIAATLCDLKAMVDKNLFRFDLLQRLNTFTFEMPPLRSRPEDIRYYTELFVADLAKNKMFVIQESGIQALLSYDWPGNVRELRNVVEQIIVFSHRGVLDQQAVYESIGNRIFSDNNNQSSKDDTGRPLRDRLIDSLILNNGNRTKTAKDFNIATSTMYRWIDRFGISDVIEGVNGRPRLEVR